ncbi:MAG: hypothetical protein ACYC26_07575 [Phycisphaerales bacterium]
MLRLLDLICVVRNEMSRIAAEHLQRVRCQNIRTDLRKCAATASDQIQTSPGMDSFPQTILRTDCTKTAPADEAAVRVTPLSSKSAQVAPADHDLLSVSTEKSDTESSKVNDDFSAFTIKAPEV